MPAKVEIGGKRYGSWTALVGGRRPNSKWLCRCECGTTREVAIGALRFGSTKSCWCASQKTFGQRLPQLHQSEYRVWQGMKSRCFNKNSFGYSRYGGRGITVCAPWRKDFARFLRDMGPRPSGYWIERENNDGDYCKANCSWQPPKGSYFNKSSTIRVRWSGVEITLSELARKLKINYDSLHSRYRRRKWSLAKSIKACQFDKILNAMK